MLIQHLTALGEARALARSLEAEAKAAEAPHITAAKAASAATRAQLVALETLLDTLEPLCRSEYQAADAVRSAALKRGEECPRVALPEGCTVRMPPHVVVDDATEIPRALCAPVASKVTAALKLGPVPGAHVEKRPVFVFARAAGEEGLAK